MCELNGKNRQTADRIDILRGTKANGKQQTPDASKSETNAGVAGENVGVSDDHINVTMDPRADSLKKREYAQEELYIRDKEREQREKAKKEN